MEEPGGVGEWGEEAQRSYPSSLSPVYFPSPVSLRTYVPSLDMILGLPYTSHLILISSETCTFLPIFTDKETEAWGKEVT